MTDVAPTLRDRLWRAFRELVLAELSFLTFHVRWEYTVNAVAADGSSADVIPLPSDPNVPPKLPPIPKCPLAPSLIGENVKLAVGGRCTVAFRNGDPSRPEIVGGDYSNPPTAIAIGGAPGSPAAARVGDAVALYAKVITLPGPITVLAIGPASGPVFAVTASGLAATAIPGGTTWGGLPPTLGAVVAAGSSVVGIGG